MDLGLFFLAMLSFAILYMVIGVFMIWVLVITFLVIFLYLAIRYKNVPENYPHGVGDSMITILFISITWALFTFLGSQGNVKVIGQGLTYISDPPWAFVAEVSLIFGVIMLCVLAILIPYLEGKMSGGGGDGGGDKGPKVGVGA